MNCKQCGHLLSQEEMKKKACKECGAGVETSLLSGIEEEMGRVISGIKKAQAESKMKSKTEGGNLSEREIAALIESVFSVLTICAAIIGLLIGMHAENFWVFFGIAFPAGLVYCNLRLMVSVIYLLSDIKQDISAKTESNNQEK